MQSPAVPGASATEKIGFFPRLLAFIVDAIVLGVVTAILTSVVFAGDVVRSQGLGTLLGLAYYVYFWSGAGGGQTLGMKVLNIKVERTDGTPLTVTGAIVRYVGLIVSFFVVLLGVIWIIFDPQKQGWHDKIAGTYVVRA
ncbi:RDD family protein [soil metagenome]